MLAPSKSPITLPFGSTAAPYSPSSPHRGTDFAHSPDNIIYAPFSGKVTQIANNYNDGNGTYMTDSQGRYHGLLHASRYLVPNSSNVTEGQPIAVMGDTGYAFGVHLHYCVKQNGKFIDPMSLINQGEDMIDAPHLSAVFVAFLGRLPEQVEFDRYVGKATASTVIDELNRSQEYKDKAARDQEAYDALAGSKYEPVNEQLYRKK